MTGAAVSLGDWLVECPDGLRDTPIRDLTLNSREVIGGAAFFALPGGSHDGRDFIADALARGASAVLAEASGLKTTNDRVVPINGLAARMPELTKAFYGDPSANMALAAVTGTNGKTSVVDFISQILRGLGLKAGSIGTLGCRLDNTVTPAANTTPDIIALTRQMAAWSAQGVDHVAMEASSHALDQGRMAGLNISVAVFTNFSRDHLDYHGSERAYLDAKLSLFTDFDVKRALFNADDPACRRVRGLADCPCIGLSLEDAEADVYIEVLSEMPLRVRMHTPFGTEEVDTPLTGSFNAFNLVAAIIAVTSMGYAFGSVASAARNVVSVPGRMEAIDSLHGPRVVIDYAHTPDALQRALAALRASTSGSLWVVFGCGGDRDRGKRPLMGATAGALADRVVVTSDNPRSEDPETIIRDVLKGVPEQVVTYAIVGRKEGIVHALKHAQPEDTVLIAGKGHEDYQVLADRRIDFSDHAVARAALMGGVA